MIFRIFLIILFLLLPFIVRANIIINEIAWMGTNISYNDEWIELYNNRETTINLDGWILKADDGAPEINLSGTIPGKEFFLLERTDDETVPGISADLIYKGALGNDGENLKLFDNSNNIADQIICLDAWPAGDNVSKQTMERISSGWQTSQNAGGTPKKENQELGIKNHEEEIKEEIKTEEPELKHIEARPLYIYPRGVVFNEILASPDGPDAENEWIEIYNENDFEIDLSGWQIKDSAGKIATHTLNKKILGLGYLVFSRPETKITLNNDGDGLNLINPKGEIIDSITFEKAPLNQSYAKTLSGWIWTTNLTPGEKNIVPASAVKSSDQKQTAKPAQNENQELGIKNQEESQKIISLNSASTPQMSVFLIAFAVALFCSIAFLIIKNNLKSFGD